MRRFCRLRDRQASNVRNLVPPCRPSETWRSAEHLKIWTWAHAHRKRAAAPVLRDTGRAETLDGAVCLQCWEPGTGSSLWRLTGRGGCEQRCGPRRSPTASARPYEEDAPQLNAPAMRAPAPTLKSIPPVVKVPCRDMGDGRTLIDSLYLPGLSPSSQYTIIYTRSTSMKGEWANLVCTIRLGS